mgnify:CR=1 FL=1|jgi:hypothetical protein
MRYITVSDLYFINSNWSPDTIVEIRNMKDCLLFTCRAQAAVRDFGEKCVMYFYENTIIICN